MYRGGSECEIGEDERIARTRNIIKTAWTACRTMWSFYISCESNEHREGARRFLAYGFEVSVRAMSGVRIRAEGIIF